MNKHVTKSKTRGGGYSAIHQWLKKYYGKASLCENKNCNSGSISFEWSKIKGKEHSHERNNYQQLCLSCHRIYDRTLEQNRKIRESCIGVNKGNKHSAKKVQKLSNDGIVLYEFESITEASKFFNKSYSTMWRIINRNNDKEFLWKIM